MFRTCDFVEARLPSFLTSLPTKVEETPYFGHRFPWRHDVNLLGEPLKINGQGFDRGLAVHSRCVLTYDLGRRYSKFEALVGFDDASRGKGRVDCRVFADGKEIYANPIFAPTRRRSSWRFRSRARKNCGCTSITVEGRTRATA